MFTGSPYTLRVSGAPDASKVVVKGPGIEHGILALYQSRFIVETKGAGAGQLTVRIRGPKGRFTCFEYTELLRIRSCLCNVFSKGIRGPKNRFSCSEYYGILRIRSCLYNVFSIKQLGGP